ncbi:MAG: hypothetical protein Q8K86_05755 [Candidatus Nanopelagicaceae bacterium]|nr:hypothetical protein [Candidatus Nanopelagicaceae bacterium]
MKQNLKYLNPIEARQLALNALARFQKARREYLEKEKRDWALFEEGADDENAEQRGIVGSKKTKSGKDDK